MAEILSTETDYSRLSVVRKADSSQEMTESKRSLHVLEEKYKAEGHGESLEQYIDSLLQRERIQNYEQYDTTLRFLTFLEYVGVMVDNNGNVHSDKARIFE